MNKLDKIKYFVYPFTLLGAEMFSACSTIIGFEHEEGSSTYLMFMIALFCLSMLFVLRDLLLSGRHINKKVIFIPIIYSICYYLDISAESNVLEWTRKSYYLHIFFSLPAIMIATILTGTKQVEKIYKNLDLIMLILALGMIASLPKMLMAGGIIKGYLNISYQSALAFGYLYYGILSKREDRYLLLKTKLYKMLSVIMCTLLALTSLASGGRGGVVLLFVIISIISLMYVEKRNIFKVIFLFIPILVVFVMFVASFVNDSALGAILEKGMERAFSYITKGGIDMSQTSNRDQVYQLAWENIEKNPWSGYGIFHTIGKYGYPHNIFLEILEQGGVLYLLFWVIILFNFLKKIIRINKCVRTYNFLIPLLLYPFTLLLFSGSYIMNATFWFFICFSLTFPKKYIENYKKNIGVR